MTSIQSSSSRVPYDLRPRKQVERRMMAHVFQLLSEAGFPISTYCYAGFGAFFFVDFILFRRILGINDMVSIEHDLSYKNRVLFNRPFKDIDVKFKSSSEYISDINRDKKYILWLDYDGPISIDHINDIESAASNLPPGSILILTFDVDFEKVKDIEIKEAPPDQKSTKWFERFYEECGDFFSPSWKSSDFTASKIHKRTVDITESVILSGLNLRENILFEPLFNFLYADGHEMLTIGGIISSRQDKRKIRMIEWDGLPFVRRKLDIEPFRIEVPVLTRKERLYIDSNMPCDPDWIPNPQDFEIDPEAVSDYRQVYRYCPLYAELLL